MAQYGVPTQPAAATAAPAPALYRVAEGAQLAGVCAGLETAGKGAALNWRLLFVVGSLFLWIPLIAYVIMAIMLPQYPTRSAALAAAGKTLPQGTPDSSNIELELVKLKKMREDELITDEEYQKLRSKVLGI